MNKTSSSSAVQQLVSDRENGGVPVEIVGDADVALGPGQQEHHQGVVEDLRSEERRVRKECLRLCRSRWSPYH